MIWCALIRSGPLAEAAIVNAINLRIGKTLISVLAFAVLAATAQEASTGTMQGAERVDRKIAALREQEDQFILRFVELPPSKRLAVWNRSSSFYNYMRSTVEWRSQGEMRSALIVQGVDAVPFLTETLRHCDLDRRIAALEVLCDMDRFVPTADLPIPVGPSVYVRVLKQGGRINPFQPVDGRRIGSIGYQALEWAVAQKEDKELNFHARAVSGNLKTELAALTLTEQFRLWREAALKSRGSTPSDRDQSITRNVLDDILIHETPESFSGFSKVLAEEKDPSVVEAAISDLRRTDTCRRRLISSQAGLQAIDAIRSVLHRPGKPSQRTPSEAQTNDEFWKTLSFEFFDDEIRLDPMSTWAVNFQAFEVLHGRKVAAPTNPFVGRGSAPPETVRFIAYLSQLDPNFPSWEYSYCPNDAQGVVDEVMHPKFKAKINRYFEAWTQFETGDPHHR